MPATTTRDSCDARSTGSLRGSMKERTERIGRVIAGVLEQALEDARAPVLVLLADGSPEAALIEALVRPRLGARLVLIPSRTAAPGDLLAAWAYAAAAHPTALVALSASKTVALLGGALPGAVLPLGDLWASQVAALCGGWSAPPSIRSLAQSAGGIEALDDALQALVDRRLHPAAACARLPGELGGTLLALWEDTRFARRFTGLVPKLGARTIGVDLFD